MSAKNFYLYGSYLFSASTVRPTLVSEVSLMDHIQHPLFVTSLSLTTLKNEQCKSEFYFHNKYWSSDKVRLVENVVMLLFAKLCVILLQSK